MKATVSRPNNCPLNTIEWLSYCCAKVTKVQIFELLQISLIFKYKTLLTLELNTKLIDFQNRRNSIEIIFTLLR
jgi:hypothetical protein